MKVEVLRRGPEWRTQSVEAVYSFHRLAREQGSQAVWLSQSGLLVTTDPAELGKDFPYEHWLALAVSQVAG